MPGRVLGPVVTDPWGKFCPNAWPTRVSTGGTLALVVLLALLAVLIGYGLVKRRAKAAATLGITLLALGGLFGLGDQRYSGWR